MTIFIAGPGTLSLSSIITSLSHSLKQHKRNSARYEDPQRDHGYAAEDREDPNEEVEVFSVPEQKYSLPLPRPEPVRRHCVRLVITNHSYYRYLVLAVALSITALLPWELSVQELSTVRYTYNTYIYYTIYIF